MGTVGRVMRHRLSCENCGATFTGRSGQKFCSPECFEEGYERPTREREPFHAATHEEIARELGCSRARVQQLERSALAKLRRPMKDFR